MATDFPTTLDVLTNPSNTDKLNNPSHSVQHQNANDAIEAIEAKVGVDGSATTTTHDYKLSGVTGSDKAASKTGTETLTNKTVNLTNNTLSGTTAQFNTALSDNDFATLAGSETLSNKTLTAPKLADLGFIADANGNELIIGDTVTSAVNELTIANAATGNAPVISATGGDTNIDLKLTPKGTGDVVLPATTSVKTDLIDEVTAANGVTVDGLNIKDGALVTANSVVTANYTDGSILPEHLVTGTGTSWAWQSWVPTWTNFTVSGSTVTAKYMQIGKTVHFKLVVVLGGGNAPGSAPIFSLPITAAALAGSGQQIPIGTANFLDSGTASYLGCTFLASTTTAIANAFNSTSTYANGNNVAATVPFAWANSDEYHAQGTYEAA